MKLWFLIFTFLCSAWCSHAQCAIQLRDTYYTVSKQQAQASVLKEQAAKAAGCTASATAYTAMYYMLRAREEWNPMSKLASFRKGKAMLNEVINANPGNVEMRMLRLAAQLNAPGFLGYNDKIEDDKRMIAEQYPHITDQDLKKRLAEVLTKAGIKLS